MEALLPFGGKTKSNLQAECTSLTCVVDACGRFVRSIRRAVQVNAVLVSSGLPQSQHCYMQKGALQDVQAAVARCVTPY